MRLLVGLTALLAIAPRLGAQQTTPGERLPVVKYVLPNGMTFLFLRREGAPTVSFATHFRAGGVDEWTGISGTAHLFERSEEHTSELQSHSDLVCRLLLEKKKRSKASAASNTPGGQRTSLIRGGGPTVREGANRL